MPRVADPLSLRKKDRFSIVTPKIWKTRGLMKMRGSVFPCRHDEIAHLVGSRVGARFCGSLSFITQIHRTRVGWGRETTSCAMNVKAILAYLIGVI